MLSIRNYQKQYPGTARPTLVIDELILENGIYWIRGINGAGKTTLFKSLAGLIPFEGSIAVNDCDIHQQRIQYMRMVSYAEAEPMYPTFLTGTDLINLYQQTKGNNSKQPLLSSLGVEQFMQQATGTYSSGMLKKLSLVLAFTGHTKWILLDEPLIALDVAAVQVLQDAIVQAHQQGVSFLITSHQPLCDDIMQQATTLSLINQSITREA